MKIVIAHNRYLQAGGEDVVAEQEARLLREHGHSVIEYRRSNAEIRLNSIGQASLFARTVWARDSYHDFATLLRKEKPTLVHFHNTFPLISPSAYYACKAFRVGVVQTLHNYRLVCASGNLFRDQEVCEDCVTRVLPVPALINRCYRGSLGQSAATASMLLTHRALRSWQRAVDLFIAPSTFLATKVAQGGIPSEKIVVKPNFTTVPAPTGNERRHAVFVGRLTAEKGILTLLEAWHGISAMRLVVVGNGPEKPRLCDLISRGGLRTVDLVGEQARAEVLRLLGSAAFLVLPSQWPEPFGLVAAEAFACGVPVIGARSGAITEIVEDGFSGLLFKTGDSHDLTCKIHWALENPSKMRRMGENARRTYLEKYTAEANYPLLMDAYQQVLNGCNARAAASTSTT